MSNLHASNASTHLIARYIGKATTATAAAAAASMSMVEQPTPQPTDSSDLFSGSNVTAISSIAMATQNLHEHMTTDTQSNLSVPLINRATQMLSSSLPTAAAAAAPTIGTLTATGTATATATATAAASLLPAWNATAALATAATATSFTNCSALFANYTHQPQTGLYCNWIWDEFLCWPPTPAGLLVRLSCPTGVLGVDTRKLANRQCEADGHWGGKPNETQRTAAGWTDYGPCFKPEVTRLMMQITDMDLVIDIAQRTRTLEIVGLCLSLFALIISLLIFCNFRSLRNNRTRIHTNLFIAMVLQVIIRLTLYLDQAFRRGKQTAAHGGIENTPYLCEASYALMEYARTAMFMWMFIEGLYLHNMVTVAVFQGNFPHKFFSLLGWGMPVLMTTVWALCTAIYMDIELGDCLWNYNLTPYYWILEGPRLVVILMNFCFLVNIIRVLVVKLRQSQASDIEQTRKAVRAAIVLLPLLGITNLLYLFSDLKTPWIFALWSYGTHFLTTFQGFFIALIYCFLNGEVRTVLLKSVSVFMSVRGHGDWVPKRVSMYSGAYNTAPDTEQPAAAPPGGKRASPPHKRHHSRKSSGASFVLTHEPRSDQAAQRQRLMQRNNNNGSSSPTIHPAVINELHTPTATATALPATASVTRIHSKESSANGSGTHSRRSKWMIVLCFGGQKNKCVMPAAQKPQQIFVTSQMTAATATATAAAATTTTADVNVDVAAEITTTATATATIA